jgi:quercetin dioxygenase-like cupin family protein
MATATATGSRFTATDIHRLPWLPLNGHPGVQFKTLWRDPRGSSYAGIIRLLPGACIPDHAHRFASHHAWIETGTCRVGEHTFGPGSYLHVPVGVFHGIDQAGEGGCTLFYLYLAAAEMD